MGLFHQIVLENEVGRYVMPRLFGKKINILYGFKAFAEDLKTTECLTGGASGEDTLRAEIGVRMEVTPGELCPEKRGLHFCEKFSQVLKNRPLKGICNRKTGYKVVKFRYFYCETGEVCITDCIPIWSTHSIVTNAIIPLFEIKLDQYSGDINNMKEINLFVEQQVQEYWKRKRLERDGEEREKRPYKCIPLYTKEQMEEAKIESDEEIINACIYRQAINGYVSLYKGGWIVGRGNKGEIIKVEEHVLIKKALDDIEHRIEKLQEHALYGRDLKGEFFCKFTYSKEFQNDYATHVELVNEYIESEVIEDGGTFGGIHFVPLCHIEVCLNNSWTYYGNKIALLEPLEDEIYYEYMENVFVGKRIFVSKVMNLYDVETWKILSGITSIIKEKKQAICNYLRGLQEEIGHESYEECIKFVSEI